MAYITYDQYVNIYGSISLNSSEFLQYATIASDLIDTVTEFRIEKAGGISSFPQSIQLLIQKAAAAQILYFFQNGLETVLTGQTGSGFTVGKVHVDGGNTSGKTQTQLMISPLVKVYLEQTGLMGRRTPCLDPFHSSYYGIW
jgi:hypothetical protein